MELSIFEEGGIKIKAHKAEIPEHAPVFYNPKICLLYTSDAADE